MGKQLIAHARADESMAIQVIIEHKATGRRPPHVLYTVPTGQNPTGTPILLAGVVSPDVNFLFCPMQC